MRSQRGPGFSLNIKPAATGDSGTYFCLVNGKPEPFSAYKLAVQGNNGHQTSDINWEKFKKNRNPFCLDLKQTFLHLPKEGLIRMKTLQPIQVLQSYDYFSFYLMLQ